VSRFTGENKCVCILHIYRKETPNPDMEIMLRICTGRRNKVEGDAKEMEQGNKFEKSFTINSTLNHERKCPRLAWSVHFIQCNIQGPGTLPTECVQPCIITRFILPLEEPP
jgi:hypothetical protein